MVRSRRQTAAYCAVVLAAFILAMLAGWTALATYIDGDAYDLFLRLDPPTPWETQSILLTIDEPTLAALGGMRAVRTFLAEGLELVARAKPRAVAADLILSEAGSEEEDRRLEEAFRQTPNLVLATDLTPDSRAWEEPLARFARWAEAAGHVHADQDPLDGVCRQIPLAKASLSRERRWALALEALRLSQNARQILESPRDVQVGGRLIPVFREGSAQAMRIRFLAPGADGSSPIPRVSFKELRERPELAARFRNRVVFVGVTAQSAARDRLMTPYYSSRLMPGVEIHANAFETMVQGRFFRPADNLTVFGVCVLIALGMALAFGLLSERKAYAAAGLILLAAHAAPYFMLQRGVVFSYSSAVSAAWLPGVAAAVFQHFAVRRQLRRAESERARYQEAVHFVAHELRTPLTAIQGSSELISRYNLNEDKRRQIASLITSESKRLARLIETFLNVERLSAGQIQLKKEGFSCLELLAGCVERVRALADRKRIRIRLEPFTGDGMTGDRELIEYAFYNLLTNAVKYSPPDTEVTVAGHRDKGRLRISVRDQGYGMSRQELRQIFTKFYRTWKAEASGEAGTGIGLSIVQQIITHHGGRIEVLSEPGKGSCFTIVMPAGEATSAPQTQ